MCEITSNDVEKRTNKSYSKSIGEYKYFSVSKIVISKISCKAPADK